MTSKEAILELICEAKSPNCNDKRISFLRRIIEEDLEILEILKNNLYEEKELLKLLKVQPEFLLCSKNLGTKYIFSKNLVNNKYYDNGKLVSGGRLGLKNLAEDLQKEIKVNNQYYFSINLASRYGDKNEILKQDSEIKSLKIKSLKRNYN